MMQHKSQRLVDDYWSKEEFIATLPIPPQDIERDVFFLWHQSREKYGAGHKDLGLKLTERGERDYFHVTACYYSPRIVLTVALTPSIAGGAYGDEIGEIAGSSNDGRLRHDIAKMQAWYYEAAKTLMLWEVDTVPSVKEPDPTKDFLLSSLWVMFEACLLERFPDCERILTPHDEPDYDRELFQAFLQERGFTPGTAGSGVFKKLRQAG